MKVELVNKTVGVGRYENLSNEEIVAAVARHGKIKEDNGKLVKYLMDNKHWSPLQHISFSFKIETSRAISAQIFRHRSLHFQETSQRYEEIQEFEPIELRREHPTNRQSSTEIFNPGLVMFTNPYTGEDEGDMFDAQTVIKEYLDDISKFYNKLIKAGVARETARMILPMCSKTTIHVSGTLRDLLAFLNIRLDLHTQKECRDIATAMGEELEKELPEIFKNIDWRNGLFM